MAVAAPTFFQAAIYKSQRDHHLAIDISGAGDLYLSPDASQARSLKLTGTITADRRLIFPMSPLDAGLKFWIDPSTVVLGGFAIKVTAYTTLPGAATPAVEAGVSITAVNANKRMVMWNGAIFQIWYIKP